MTLNLNLCSWNLNSTKQTEEEEQRRRKKMIQNLNNYFIINLKIEIPFIATIKLQITAAMI